MVAYAHQSDNWTLYVSLDDSLDEKDKGTRHLEAVEYHHDHTKSQGKKKPYYTNGAVHVEVRLALGARSYAYDGRLYLREQTLRRLNRERAPEQRLHFRKKTLGNRHHLRPGSGAVNRAADAADTVLRLSMDAKATVKVGPFARGGKSRVPTVAADHDFHPEATVTPVGLSLPALDELFLYGITSKVTSDCLVDCLERWWERVHERFAHITTLAINLDNGPENHSRRTQFMRRMVDFAHHTGLTVRLASYPPSHSKYNSIERCWGILENHWNGALLDSIDAVIRLATTMTWKGKRPVVELITTTYQTGVKLTKDAMQMVETQLQRLPGLDKWFVDIVPTSSTIPAT